MASDDVHSVLDHLESADVWVGIAGGWGIDALVGHQTRDHDDLHISVRFEQTDVALDVLARSGYTIHVDWRPVRVAFRDDLDRQVDVHPLRFRADGSALQAGLHGASYDYPADAWTTGCIAGRPVLCITAALQHRFHTGYELLPKDRTDLATLEHAGLLGEAPAP